MSLISYNSKKYNWIDFGRGIAILLVIIVHVGQNFPNPTFLKKFTETGAFGVQLFFILSALTLFHSYTHRYETDGKERVKFFFIRRFFRIAPLYYFFALFYTVLTIIFKGIYFPTYWKILMSILFLNGIFVPVINNIPPGGWSIGTEVLFYCLVPFLFKKVKTIKDAIILLVIAILFSNVINYIAFEKISVYQWLPNQFPVFCFGILLFYVLKALEFPSIIQKILLITSILLFVWLSQIDLSSQSCFFATQRLYEYALVFSFFIIGIKDYEFKSKLGSLFRSIGKYSFSMYLLHFFILRVFLILLHFSGLQKNEMVFLISYILVTVITFFISSILHVYEKKGIAYGNLQIEKIKHRFIKN